VRRRGGQRGDAASLTSSASPPRAADALARELRDTDDALRPLHALLDEATERCREQSRKIAASKANVAKNDARIQELLRMVVFK
jgi:phage-related tail protein